MKKKHDPYDIWSWPEDKHGNTLPGLLMENFCYLYAIVPAIVIGLAIWLVSLLFEKEDDNSSIK